MLRLRTVRWAVATPMLLVALLWAAGAVAADPSSSAAVETSARIVNGTVTSSFASTGALLSPSNPGIATTVCSGTLIGCQTFLTAGHCVVDDLNPTHYTVFLQHAGFFTVSSIALHPDFDFPVGDVAVLKLATAVNGIRPTPINTTTAPTTGLVGAIVGFGRTGGFNQDYGIKRTGIVTTATCKNGVSGTTSVCWNFEAPLGTPGTNSNTCNGDSGGPLLIDFGTGLRVAGVTSGGNSDTCQVGDASFDANVFVYRSWIQQQAGIDLGNTTCGSLPQVDDTGTTVVPFSGQVSSSSPIATHTFQVTPGASALRVSMNAIDNGSDFDLFVKAGSPPSTTSFDCRQNGQGQFAFCEFALPVAGTWYVLVQQASGSGTYQVTATTFNGGCGDSANAGQPCDDNNACTVNDRCQTGACVGAAATNGTGCDDGDACTHNDSCQAGVCAGSATPRTDCHQPFVTPSGIFRLQDTTPGEPATSDKLTWDWLRGGATEKAEFGDPLSTTAYDLCVFDETAGTASLILSQRVTGGALCGTKSCWKEATRSFRYTDRKQLNGPITSLYLREGEDGKAKITLRAKGTKLSMPALPLHEQDTVTVQLSNDTACWQAQYRNSTRNDVLEFKAKAD